MFVFALVLLFAVASNAFSISYYLGTQCAGDPVFHKRYDHDEHQCFNIPAIGSLSFECNEDTVTPEQDYIHAVVTLCSQEGPVRSCDTDCNTKSYARDECVSDGQISWTYTCSANSFGSTLAAFLLVVFV